MNGISKLWGRGGGGAHRQEAKAPASTWTRCLFPLMTALALAWFLVRVIPKPIRATYPCQQAAFPLASAFAIWLLGLKGSLLALFSLQGRARRLRPVFIVACVVFASGLAAWGVGQVARRLAAAPPAWTPSEPPNTPIGVARGICPGRVAWMHAPAAATWDGSTNDFFEDRFTSLSVVETMFSKVIRRVASQDTDAQAWDAIFRHYNQTHDRGTNGYQGHETIAIKININNTYFPRSQRLIDASPQTVKALLRQLVHQAGVPPTNLIVYDAQRFMSNVWRYCSNEFPTVQFRERSSTTWVPDAVTFASGDVSNTSRRLPQYVVDATYVINMAVLKRHVDVTSLEEWTTQHGQTAITCCFKNHFGSSGLPSGMHTAIRDFTNGMASYNALVDLNGSRHLAGKTILYLLDGLYGAPGMSAVPVRWTMPPFHTNRPASLFASQDLVAIDSVALDFLRAEWGVMPNADNFLHEAALANAPPSGTAYAPDGEGRRLSSLGVHEHWNNPVAKQCSRNLGTGQGIELVAVHAWPALSVAVTGPTNTLQLSWPVEASEYHLQAQTNPVGAGLTADWVDVPEATPPWLVPIVATNGSVFYRLKAPR